LHGLIAALLPLCTTMEDVWSQSIGLSRKGGVWCGVAVCFDSPRRKSACCKIILSYRCVENQVMNKSTRSTKVSYACRQVGISSSLPRTDTFNNSSKFEGDARIESQWSPACLGSMFGYMSRVRVGVELRAIVLIKTSLFEPSNRTHVCVHLGVIRPC
jgi:hypothetical protein